MTFCKTCVKIAKESTQDPPPKVKQAAFNIPGKNQAYCTEHADKETMVDVRKSKRPTCEFEGCSTRASFNEFGKRPGIRCVTHKLDNMVDVHSKKCIICITEPQYIPSETNPAPKIPLASFGGKFCVDHREPSMRAPHNICEFTDCPKQASFNIIGRPPRYCSPHGKLIFGDKCVNVTEKRCKHDRVASTCAESDCMGSRICFMCCQRNRRPRCKYTYKPDPSKEETETTTLCCTCYSRVKLADLLVGKTPAQAIKILRRKIHGKMKEARVLKSIIEAFSDKTWHAQSHVPMCDMKLTNKRYFTDLELDIGAIYAMIFENDERQHGSIACELPRMNNIVAAKGGRHLVFIRFNPDTFKHSRKTYPSMFNADNEPTEVYATRMPEVIKIIDAEIQRAAFLEQSTQAVVDEDPLIRIVYINYSDTSPAVADAIKMVGCENIVVYHTC